MHMVRIQVHIEQMDIKVGPGKPCPFLAAKVASQGCLIRGSGGLVIHDPLDIRPRESVVDHLDQVFRGAMASPRLPVTAGRVRGQGVEVLTLRRRNMNGDSDASFISGMKHPCNTAGAAALHTTNLGITSHGVTQRSNGSSGCTRRVLRKRMTSKAGCDRHFNTFHILPLALCLRLLMVLVYQWYLVDTTLCHVNWVIVYTQ